MATRKKPVTLDPKMVERTVQAFRKAWDYIAYDSLQLLEQEQGKGAVYGPLEAAEITADYIHAYGGDKEAADWFFKLNMKEQDEVMRKVFTRPQGM